MLMKVATILPQTHLESTRYDSYLMALAHLIDKPGMETYTEFFKEKSKEPGTFIIMDNGLIEGDPRPISELLDKALSIGADELILPDVFRDSLATLNAVNTATDYLVSQGERIQGMGFMAVPQGKTLDEWLDCASMLLNNPLVTCLGIPKVLVDIAGRDGRYDAIEALMERVHDLNGVALHLLGCWRTPLEVSIIAKGMEIGDLPEIRGVDSAIPYVFARAGLYINEDDRPDSNPIDFADGKLEEGSKLEYNILLWRDAVDMRKQKELYFI